MKNRTFLLFRALMCFVVIGVSTSAYAGHRLSNKFFLLANHLKVQIYLENEYSFSGKALEKLSKFLVDSLKESWTVDQNNGGGNTVAIVSIAVYAAESDDKEVFQTAVTPNIFKSGQQGYNEFIQEVRSVGKPKLSNGGRKYDDGWPDEKPK